MCKSLSTATFNRSAFNLAIVAGMHKSMTRLYEIARAAGHERPSEVAHAMNEAQQTLKNWESRGISKAGLIKAQSIYGVNASWLETGKGNKGLAIVYPARQQESSYGNIGEKMPLRGRVPLISYVAAGNWSEAVDNFSPGNADAWIDTTIAVKQHTYALRVQGDLMEPKFPDGAIIIVEPEEEAKNGSFVIVRQNGSDATFKQLVYDGSQAYLKPLNQRYLTMPMQPDTVICGVVKQMVMDV